jgi:hypothetical protein
MLLLSAISYAVAELVSFFTNDDDLVMKRDVAFTASALTALREKEVSMMFDGGSQGKHELWIAVYNW